MSFLDKAKSFFNRIFGRDNTDYIKFLEEALPQEMQEVPEATQEPIEEEPINIELPENEIVSISDEILDTNSKASKEKLKHNLKVLMQEAKEKGKIDKFMIIREDDFFPHDWEWRVLSKETNWEKEVNSLSIAIKRAYAMRQAGLDEYNDLFGMKVPRATNNEIYEAMKNVDRNLGAVLAPSRFRSTKHFTVNTPLEVTGDYNFVDTDRDYIVIDNMQNFLDSGYAYSVGYKDAYLDVSHESLPISEQAVVLINDENYERIMADEKVASELAQRRVIRYKGDTTLAIDMALSEMGVLPSRIGSDYANYDMAIQNILESSMRCLARDNNLFFEKSHAGSLTPEGGHFSNYYDDKNKDYQKAFGEFVGFLRQKFPEHEELFPDYKVSFSGTESEKIVDKLGVDSLLEAIGEYNEKAAEKAKQNLEQYKEDRKSITPIIHEQFTQTIALINDLYKNRDIFQSLDERVQMEEAIQGFLQGDTVIEQQKSAKRVYELVKARELNKSEVTNEETQEIKMQDNKRQEGPTPIEH